MSQYRKPFSPVDANKKASRVGANVKKNVSWPSNRSIASARTAESYADDSEFAFLSNAHATAPKIALLSEVVWNSKTKTPRISNLGTSTASVTSTATTTTTAKANPVKPQPPFKQKISKDVSTKARFSSRNLTEPNDGMEQRSTRLPPHPKKRRRRKTPKKLIDDATSILQIGVALETIAEDAEAEERVSPTDENSTSTNFDSDTPLINLATKQFKETQNASRPSSSTDPSSASPMEEYSTPRLATQPSPPAESGPSATPAANAEEDPRDVNESSDMDESPGGDLLELTMSPPPSNVDVPSNECRVSHLGPMVSTPFHTHESKSPAIGSTTSNEDALHSEAELHREKVICGGPSKQEKNDKSPSLAALMPDPVRESHHTPIDCKESMLPRSDPELNTLPGMEESKPERLQKPDQKIRPHEPIDKEVWMAMNAEQEKSTFPVSILVPTPARWSGDDVSTDASELTQDTSLLVTRKRSQPEFVVKVGRKLWDTFNEIKTQQSSVKGPCKTPCKPAAKGDGKQRGPTRDHVQVDQMRGDIEHPFESEQRRDEVSSVLSTRKSFPDIPSSSLSAKKEQTFPRGKTPSLWTTEHAGVRFKELGVNLAPIFRLNGQYFRHPPLPPGWTISISRSKNIPFYHHPTFGSTFYSPVPLPSGDGSILGATILLQTETPMETLGMKVRDSVFDRCATPARQKAGNQVKTNFPLSVRSKQLTTPELFSGISSSVRALARGENINAQRQSAIFRENPFTSPWDSLGHEKSHSAPMTPMSKVSVPMQSDLALRLTSSPPLSLTSNSVKERDCITGSRQSSRGEKLHTSPKSRQGIDNTSVPYETPHPSPKERQGIDNTPLLDQTPHSSPIERHGIDNTSLPDQTPHSSPKESHGIDNTPPPDQTPDCQSFGSSFASGSRGANEADDESPSNQSAGIGVPTDIVVVNKPLEMASTDKFILDLDAARMSRKPRSKGHGSILASVAEKGEAREPDMYSCSSSNRGNVSIESRWQEASVSPLAAMDGSYSSQKQCNTPMVGSARSSSSSKLDPEDPFSTPGGEKEKGTVSQKRKHSTPYFSAKFSSDVENERARSPTHSLKETQSPGNAFSPPNDGFDFDDLQSRDDSPTSEGKLSPTIPTKVIVAHGSDDDSMSHMQNTPAFRPEPAKISTRYKPTTVLPAKENDTQYPMEDRTIRSYGSMNSLSCNSNLSRASHRAMNPSLPLCALRNVAPSEDEESVIAAYIAKKKRKLKSKPKPKKKARKTKHVSPDDSSTQS